MRGERHAGLKNVHVVSAPVGAPYWTPFAFFGTADQPQLIRIPPAQGAKGWSLGLVLAKGKQKNLKLTGVTKSAPTAQMQQALKARLGAGVSQFDTSALYSVDNLQKGGILEGVALLQGPRGGALQAMLLLVPRRRGGRVARCWCCRKNEAPLWAAANSACR